ncbi:MAG: hypothetical protein BGP12_17165 [Rhodospirillales bacterium 70-18]|nr:MAG: hypothetical protein BGP12_17165 [Rhodospirillales bacterium 70-18]
MTDSLEFAKEGLEHAGHARHGDTHGNAHDDNGARKIAVLIAALAATLAVAEMAEKGAQNGYLTHHIQAADDWAFYQAKTIRANLYATHAETLDALAAGRAAWARDAGARDAGGRDAALDREAAAALGKQAAAARGTSARLNDDPQGGEGRAQLLRKAQASEALRDRAFHRYHLFEGVVGALQIAIVLASVSVVTRVGALALGAGVLGGAAAVFAALVAGGLF